MSGVRGTFKIFDDTGKPLQSGQQVAVQGDNNGVSSGAAAPIFSDDAGTASISGSTVYTNQYGEVTFVAQPGYYWLEATGGRLGGQRVYLSGTEWGATHKIVAGAVAVANNVWTPGYGVPMGSKLVSVKARCGTAPTGTAGITIRVNKNGAAAGTVNIAATAVLSGAWTPAPSPLPLACAAGDVLTFDVTTVGGTVAGSDVAVDLLFDI